MHIAFWDYSSFILYLIQAFIGMYCLANITKRYKDLSNRQLLKMPYVLLMLISWTFFATFRTIAWGIGGTDSINYIVFFKNSWGIFDEIMEHTASDVAFLWLNRTIRYFTSNYHIYFAIVYGFMTFSIILFARRFCYKFYSFIPLLLAFYLFLRGYNTLRSNLAISFILLGLLNVVDNKYKWAYLYMICSALTHKAGVLFALTIPFVHVAKVREIKTKYLVMLSAIVFLLGTSIRDYFIAFASSNDLGGAYKSYASEAKETGSLLSGIVECFMQYLLAIIVLFSTRRIKTSISSYGEHVANTVNVLLYICYFDMMLIPLNAMLGIWRGYEFLYIPRLCMWGIILWEYLRKTNITVRAFIKLLVLLYFIFWFTFRLYRTYEASDLMPYVLDFL